MAASAARNGRTEAKKKRRKQIVAHLSLGRAVGQDVGGGVCCFAGLPFAAAPVGNGRWRRPAKARPWKGKLDCRVKRPRDKRKSRPIQFEDDIVYRNESEDCLYAHVWAPSQAVHVGRRKKNALLPVHVFIDGGALEVGYLGKVDADGGCFAKLGIVHVQGNYRHGPLGFFCPHGGDFNCGLWDQVALLRWVQKEIHAFGGDKNRVTIHGQSGGADLALALCVSPVCNRLFHRAIVESPSTIAFTVAQAKEIVEAFATAAGKSSARLEDLSQLSIKQLKVAYSKKCYSVTIPGSPGMAFASSCRRSLSGLPSNEAPGSFERSPSGLLQTSDKCLSNPSLVVDGELLPEEPLSALLHGKASHLEIIIGSHRGEAVGDFRAYNMGGVVRRVAWELAASPGAAGLGKDALHGHVRQLIGAYEQERDKDPLGLIQHGKFGRSPSQQVMNLLMSDLLYGVYCHLAAERLAAPRRCRRLYRIELVGSDACGANHGDGFWVVGKHDYDEKGPPSKQNILQWRDLYGSFIHTGNPNWDGLAACATANGSTASDEKERAYWPPCKGGTSHVLCWDLIHGGSVCHKGVRFGSRSGFRALCSKYEKLWRIEKMKSSPTRLNFQRQRLCSQSSGHEAKRRRKG
eukprot:TRINITY_DN27646_c0_g1_i1.p1 TRINITY_DN27646_c0_g1~~TRINITY_DN27646_c0_g1_i1.p1  ORF type:complete len:650 (-),score=55.16 TRINITY_DN27646_c0_g1_i1:305-2197(-)